MIAIKGEYRNRYKVSGGNVPLLTKEGLLVPQLSCGRGGLIHRFVIPVMHIRCGVNSSRDPINHTAMPAPRLVRGHSREGGNPV